MIRSRSATARTWAALGTVYVVWGSTYLAIRVGVAPSHGPGLPPLVMSGARFTLAGLLMLAAFARRDPGDPIGVRQWLASAVVGTSLLLGGNGLVSVGEQWLTSGTAALIVGCVPVFGAVIAAAIGREQFTWIRALGLVVGLAGVAVLSAGSGGGHDSPGGIATVLVAALLWSAGSVYAQRAPLPRRPLVGTGMEMLTGGLVSLVVSAAAGEWQGFSVDRIPAQSWWAFGYLVVAGSMLAYTAYAWLLANAPLSLATTYAYVNPVVAVALGAVLLGEPFTPRTALAAALVVGGVALVVSAGRRVAPPAPAAEPAAPAGATQGCGAGVTDR